VRWYLRYCLSYRGLEEMMAERGLNLDHTTIYRWVQRYAPELEKRCQPKTTLAVAARCMESVQHHHKRPAQTPIARTR
jgi:transposase-like protein